MLRIPIEYSDIKNCDRVKSDYGFTLIEMLVVILIVGILVSLLVPALQESLDAARSVECQNNLKSIGVLQYSYSEYNNGFTPLIRDNVTYVTWSQTMQNTGLLENQVQDGKSVLVCPQAPTLKGRFKNYECTYGMADYSGGSLYIMAKTSGYEYVSSVKSGVWRLSRVKNPSNQFINGDSRGSDISGVDEGYPQYILNVIRDGGSGGRFHRAHHKNKNIAFLMADGHAEFIDWYIAAIDFGIKKKANRYYPELTNDELLQIP